MNKDKDFVCSVGLSIAAISEVVRKTRSTVKKNIDSEDRAFSALDIMKICEFIGRDDPDSAHLAKRIAIRLYPEYSRFLEGEEPNAHLEIHSDIPMEGEFALVCRDFTAFKANYKKCIEELGIIKSRDNNVITAFVRGEDTKSVSRFFAFSETGSCAQFVPIVCDSASLDHHAGTLFHTDGDDRSRMFVAHLPGFKEAAPFDAARLLEIFKDKRIHQLES